MKFRIGKRKAWNIMDKLSLTNETLSAKRTQRVSVRQLGPLNPYTRDLAETKK